MSELRASGASVRHSNGINTCVRCHSHYLPHQSEQLDCAFHPQQVTEEGDYDDSIRVYSCCQTQIGMKGCKATVHLPIYQVDEHGKINGEKVKYHPKMDVHVGRWMKTNVVLTSATCSVTSPPVSANSSSTSSSSSSSSASSSAAAYVPVPVPAPSIPSSIPIPSSLNTPVSRVGDEIMVTPHYTTPPLDLTRYDIRQVNYFKSLNVCGKLYHTGTPVILWSDVGGYDHYRVERRYCPFEEASWATTQHELPDAFTTPNRFGLRKNGLTPSEVEAVRGGQWDLPTLTKQMKQFVLHYDEAGLSQQCFRILQDQRDLSIHFMCDLDGTIYQNLDLKERAYHATTSNTMSVGCEIANVGAYDPNGPNPFADWYAVDGLGQTYITIPPVFGNGGIHTPGFVGHPSENLPITGIIQGQNLVQYDYTPQQYASISKLLATFCSIFPAIPLTYPTDQFGQLIRQKLPDEKLALYTGIMGHFHIQTNKIDPGPAMNWDLIIKQAQAYKAQIAQQSVIASADASSTLSVLRKMDRKVFWMAEDTASRLANPTDKFYFIEGKWMNSFNAWISSDDAINRPGPIPNSLLLELDERTPRAGLIFKKDYVVTHEIVWREMKECFGGEITIVRDVTNIYAVNPPAASASASVSASSSSSSADPWVLITTTQPSVSFFPSVPTRIPSTQTFSNSSIAQWIRFTRPGVIHSIRLFIHSKQPAVVKLWKVDSNHPASNQILLNQAVVNPTDMFGWVTVPLAASEHVLAGPLYALTVDMSDETTIGQETLIHPGSNIYGVCMIHALVGSKHQWPTTLSPHLFMLDVVFKPSSASSSVQREYEYADLEREAMQKVDDRSRLVAHCANSKLSK